MKIYKEKHSNIFHILNDGKYFIIDETYVGWLIKPQKKAQDEMYLHALYKLISIDEFVEFTGLNLFLTKPEKTIEQTKKDKNDESFDYLNTCLVAFCNKCKIKLSFIEKSNDRKYSKHKLMFIKYAFDNNKAINTTTLAQYMNYSRSSIVTNMHNNINKNNELLNEYNTLFKCVK